MVRKLTEAEKRRERARNRRYKKAAVKGLTLDEIRFNLQDMWEKTTNVAYWTDSDDQTLTDALEGDEDDAQRFRLDFAALDADIEQMVNDLDNVWEPELFDDILVVSGIGRQKGESLFGFDEYEQDYFGIEPFEYGWAESESMKRLERLTKKQLMEQMAQTLSITYAYIGIRSRYEDLETTLDILTAKNREYLDAVKEINELYNSIDFKAWGYKDCEEFGKLDRIAERLPQEAFL